MTVLLAVAFAVTPSPSLEPPTDCRPGFRAPRPADPPDQLASDRYPLLVHFDASASPNETARAEATLAALETSWEVQVEQLGFLPPVLPDAAGGPEYDVYFIDYYPGAAFVANDGWSDAVIGDGLSSTSSYMVIDHGLPAAWLESYVAHEFNHACQYATDFTEFSLPIWEGTANAAAGWTFGPSAQWDYNVESWQQAANWPTLVSSGSYTWYGAGIGYYFEYGAALWVVFLDEKYGTGDGQKGAELWANTANEGFGLEPDAVDAFAATAGTTVGEALNHLAVVRFLTGPDWDDRGLIDAATWGPERAVPAQPVPADQLPWVAQEPALQPFVTGQIFLDVDLAGLPAATGGTEWLDVSLHSPSGFEAGLALLWWDDAGQVGDTRTAGVDPTASLPTDGVTRVVVAVTHLGPTDWDGDDDPYVRGDFQVSLAPRVDTAVDTGPLDTGTPPDDTSTSTIDTDTEPTNETSSPASPRKAETGGCGCSAGARPHILQGLARRRLPR